MRELYPGCTMRESLCKFEKVKTVSLPEHSGPTNTKYSLLLFQTVVNTLIIRGRRLFFTELFLYVVVTES